MTQDKTLVEVKCLVCGQTGKFTGTLEQILRLRCKHCGDDSDGSEGAAAEDKDNKTVSQPAS